MPDGPGLTFGSDGRMRARVAPARRDGVWRDISVLSTGPNPLAKLIE